MEDKLIVLRSRRSQTRDPFRGPVFRSTRVEEVPSVTVEVTGARLNDLTNLSRDEDVVGVAPPMPMMLIKPLAAGAAGSAEPGALSWGVRAVGADSSPFSGTGVIVAVLDTGIDAAHPAFSGVTLVREDFTGEGNEDDDGHGTHCSGTIFGREVSGTRIGIAPGVTKALIGKVIGRQGGSSDAIMRAILWAAEGGANVISMSVGIDFPGYQRALVAEGVPEEVATSRALEGYRANVMLFERLAGLVRAQALFGQVSLLVAAAGNESRSDLDPSFVIAVSPPAVAEGVISVAAVGQSPEGLQRASFSNVGANIAAPGVNIVSAAPGGKLRALSGTSMATPHVAGVAALWAEKLKAGGSAALQQLSARLLASGRTDTLKPGFDAFDVGAGVVQAPQG